MKKQLIILTMIMSLMLIFLINNQYSLQQNNGTVTGGFPDKVIGMSAQEYRAYLQDNTPLDRLYAKEGLLYFLVSDEELAGVEASGNSISSRTMAKDLGVYYGIASQNRYGMKQGDINGAYHNMAETASYLRDLEARYPDLAEVITIGKSFEGRELLVLKISDNVQNDEAEPNIFIVGCHHAREWISVEMPLLFANHLLSQYDSDAEVRRAVSGAQIYIMPIMNPDGLEFSIHTYRFWRKNRRYQGNFAWGVDPNRNYGYKWGHDNIGSSSSPWSYVYRGPSAFSEVETQAVRDFLLQHPPAGSISYHNFSQIIIYPWGYTYEPTEDAAEMNAIAAGMSERMEPVNQRVYDYGASDILYPVNGDTIDWIYGTFGTPAFTIELPPEYLEMGGFFTPEEMIGPTFNENVPALIYFVNYFVSGENMVTAPHPKEQSQQKNKTDFKR
jgi:carboxypeptidase T